MPKKILADGKFFIVLSDVDTLGFGGIGKICVSRSNQL